MLISENHKKELKDKYLKELLPDKERVELCKLLQKTKEEFDQTKQDSKMDKDTRKAILRKLTTVSIHSWCLYLGYEGALSNYWNDPCPVISLKRPR